MDPSDLKPTEPHPMAPDALMWIDDNFNLTQLFRASEAFASCAMSGNRLAEVCNGTLQRLINDEPVSDRYLLGLAWYLKKHKEKEKCE